MWFIDTVGYHSATRKKETLTFVATWMKGIMLSETAKQIKRNVYTESKKSKLRERKWDGGYQRLSGWGIRETVLKGHKHPVL